MSAPASEDSRPALRAPAPEALATMDLFALGRQAAAARDARWAGRGFFVRTRPPENDGREADRIVRFPFKLGETDAERLDRLAAIAAAAEAPFGVMPAPVGEPFGLDTLRCFALCRLALPRVAHVLADVTTLGPRLAQMAFGFGADELYAPIVAERALRLGANANNPSLTRKEAVTLIRGAGLLPCERMADGSVAEEVQVVELLPRAQGLALHLAIPGARFDALQARRRSLTGRSGCGLCGAETLEQAIAPVRRVTRSE